MTDRELKKLKRTDLLEMMLEQGEELEVLRKQLKEAEEKIKSQQEEIQRYSSIADAALNLSGIFETAQAAADVYVENIKKKEEEVPKKISQAVSRLEERPRKISRVVPQIKGVADIKNNPAVSRLLENVKTLKKK